MRPIRLVLLALGMAALVPGIARAQRVRLEVTAVNQTGVWRPQVTTPGILRDNRWREALQNAFPLRLLYRVEVWRVRTDWFDALERSFEWEFVIQFEPLIDEYTKTWIHGGQPRQITRFSGLADLERNLESRLAVNVSPGGAGEYYFTVALQIRTLTDEEMEELERFLQGQPAPTEREGRGLLGRAARRLLLQIGGLPSANLEARSERFVVR